MPECLFIFMKSRPSFRSGHIRLKTRSVGQILEKRSILSKQHNIDSIFIKLPASCCSMKSRPDSKLGHVHSIRSLGQILEKPCVHSRRHSLDPNFMKLCPNVRTNLKLDHFRSKVGHKAKS